MNCQVNSDWANFILSLNWIANTDTNIQFPVSNFVKLGKIKIQDDYDFIIIIIIIGV